MKTRQISAAFCAFLILIACYISGGRLANAEHSSARDSSDPAGILDWHITGPTGGDVRALVVDPSDPQRLYFGTLDGQLYTSSNGGQQWGLLYNFRRPKLFMDHIIVDPRDSKTIYVATHRHKDPGGFFKTIDGGQTWHEAPDLKNEAIHSLTQSAFDPNTLVAGTNRGIFRSSDAGESWTQLPTSASAPSLVNVESLAIDPRNTNVIYAGTWYLPYKTVDGGQTWKTIKTGIIDDSDVFAINIDPRNPDHVIASACSGIYDTRSGGDVWRKVQGIPSQSRRTRAIMQHPSVPGAVFAGTTEGFWRSNRGGGDGSWMLMTSRLLEINSIAVHPKNPDTVYIGTNNYGVMVSHDGGKTFLPSNGGYSSRFINSITPDRERAGRIYATTINTTTGGGFFFVSNDNGMSWQPSMHNMPPRLIGYSLLQDEVNNNILYLGTNLGMYHSLDRGESWSPLVPPPSPMPLRRRARRNSRAVSSRIQPASTNSPSRPADDIRRAQEALNAAGYNAGAPDGRYGRLTNAAIAKFQNAKGLVVSGALDEATLTALGLGGTVSGSTTANMPVKIPALSEPINALATTYNPADGTPGILAATNIGLFRSYNPSKGWEKIPYGGAFDVRTTCISTTVKSPGTIWIGTAKSGVLVSRNGGESWQQVEKIPTDAPVNTIVQDGKRSSYIYVGTKQMFLSSHDGGENWTRRGGNLPYGDFPAILVNPRNGDELFVGNAYDQAGGVYHSIDAGLTWARVDPRDPQLPSPHIWALAFDPFALNRIFVGSHSAGVYVADRESSASAGLDK